MKNKRCKTVLCLLLTAVLLWTCCTPVFASTAAQTSPSAQAELNAAPVWQILRDWVRSIWNRIKMHWEVRKENVPNTKNQNAIHMLKSVTDTICDSFILTTADGKVIVIDGGHKTETDYFLAYLQAVTGQRRPHVDAWFLSHAHDDHCEVFLEIVGNRSRAVDFDKVYANFPDASFYEGKDDWAFKIAGAYNRLLPSFADKAEQLHEGQILPIGDAKFTILYTFNPAWTNCNEGSTIMRMDLGGTSVMFTGDAGVKAGNYVTEKYADSGILRCDYCKMAHHGQDGVNKSFYEAVAPAVCLWPTPSWVWDNRSGNLKTLEVRAWMEELSVQKQYIAMNGSSVIGMKPRIVTTTDVFPERYPAEQAVDRLAKLGYEGVDMGFDYWVYDETSPFLGTGYLDWARTLKARADEAGIAFTHAHAPGEADAGERIERSIRAASVLGARTLVLHPVWHEKNGSVIRSRLRFLQVNADAFRQWLPEAEQYGVSLLVENVLWGASADPRVIAELVRLVDSDWLGWCFDVGHAYCCGYAPSILQKCAVAPRSVHIQDNDGSGDGHLIPGDGTIDWALFASSLRDAGYLGDCVLEAHHQSLDAPDEQRDAILSRLLETAQSLRAELR